VILTRLFVREKLNILVIIPLVVVLVTTVPFVADRLTAARNAAQLAGETKAAREVARLVQELQRERLLSLAFLAAPRLPDRLPLVRQAYTVTDVVAQVRSALADQPQLAVHAALPAVGQLASTRKRVLASQANSVEVYTAFRSVIAQLTGGLRGGAAAGAVGADHVAAFRALAAANEEADSAGAAMMVGLAPDVRSRAKAAALIVSSRALERVYVEEFQELAEPAHAGLFDVVWPGAAAPAITEVGKLAGLGTASHQSSADRSRAATELFGAVQAQSKTRLLVQNRVAQDVEGELTKAARQGQIAAALIGALSLVTVTLVVALSVIVGRSIARPLRRLAVSAGQVSDLARAELVRVSDEDMIDNIAPPQLAAIDIRSSDEIGELAVAFNRVQATAALLLERQVVTRRNFATMFANVGRRTQNLVGRQLALIDQLERDERDAEVLENLYRLDHLSTRLQRSANSLVVLSGRAEEAALSQPMPLANAIRAGLGEIEGFRQVQLIEIDRVLLTPSSALDIILLLAELLENATSFSPPHVPVEVTARVLDGKCTVLIVDHGIGMSDEQLAEENRRLVERERLDLVPTDVLGLFVVGRLARRHSLSVKLRPTPGGGVTAEVTIPSTHLIRLAPDGPDGQSELVLGGPVRRGRPTGELKAAAPSPDGSAGALVQPIQPVQPGLGPTAGRALVAEPGTAGQRDTPDAGVSGEIGNTGAFRWWGSHHRPERTLSSPPAGEPPPPGAANFRRRVRGAHVPDTGPPPQPVQAPPDPAASAHAARAMVEEFEAAVRQAGGINNAINNAINSAPNAPPGADGLRRRVRGAQLPATETVLAHTRGWERGARDAPEARESSADAARAMVDEFESGVTRANGLSGDGDGRQQ
jgi:signal transduction histidine kinase